MRETIFRFLRRLSLTWLGHSPATRQKQEELQGIERRRTYMFDRTLEVIRETLSKNPDLTPKIVEVGIGTGGFTTRLREISKKGLIIGVDPEVFGGNPIANGRVCADGRSLPIEVEGVDLVASTLVLHLLVQPDGLKEVKSLIREAQRTAQSVVFMDILGSLWSVFFAPIGALILEGVSLSFGWHTLRVMLSCLTRREYEQLAREFDLELFIWGPNPFYPKVAILYSPTD